MIKLNVDLNSDVYIYIFMVFFTLLSISKSSFSTTESWYTLELQFSVQQGTVQETITADAWSIPKKPLGFRSNAF